MDFYMVKRFFYNLLSRFKGTNYNEYKCKNCEYDILSLKQEVSFVKLNTEAKAPFKKHEGDAGYDLFANLPEKQSITIEPNDQAKIPTGIAVSLNKCTVGIINDRSSMAFKKQIVTGGVIDEPYTGEISVLLFNLSKEPYQINHGDKIAQMVIFPIVQATFIEKESLQETERGNNGFGSTGT